MSDSTRILNTLLRGEIHQFVRHAAGRGAKSILNFLEYFFGFETTEFMAGISLQGSRSPIPFCFSETLQPAFNVFPLFRRRSQHHPVSTHFSQKRCKSHVQHILLHNLPSDLSRKCPSEATLIRVWPPAPTRWPRLPRQRSFFFLKYFKYFSNWVAALNMSFKSCNLFFSFLFFCAKKRFVGGRHALWRRSCCPESCQTDRARAIKFCFRGRSSTVVL
jgi:hypothetical protein